MPQSVEPPTRRGRPRAVSFVASVLVVEALVVVFIGAAMASAELAKMPPTAGAPDDAFEPYLGILPGLSLALVIVVAGGGLALASVGLLHLREWAWTLAMTLQGLGLADALYNTYHGRPEHLKLALCSFVVLVLNQREVREAFDLRHQDG